MRLHLVLLAFLAVPAQAQVQEVVIGNVNVSLTPPVGHCVLTDAQPSDSRVLHASRTAIPPGNRLLAMTAHCDQLKEWRVGKLAVLGDIAQFQTLHQVQDFSADPQGSMRELCALMRQQGGELVAKVPGEANQRMQAAAISVKVNETKFLGVIAEEPQVCYAAALLKVRSEQGNEITRVTVLASTVVKGRLVFYYLTAPYNEKRPFEDLLVRHRANMAAFRSANAN
jgi:hypothetical protein